MKQNYTGIIKKCFKKLNINGLLNIANYFIRYQDTLDFVVLGAEIVLFFFIIYYSIEESIEMVKLGKQYFKGIYNNTDYIALILCFIILGHRCNWES